ncbi:hypothetical protein [Noviherbaspirillum malthae]|jgi:hypothetical protein|uniref:hypothetical protein n=1 Tax=Noviherbaspirillum malthae TaxID=1260987 RepID=UPI00188EF744|nr:hypothetical protein [Noviherbaspirillum malthae]
MNDLANQSDQWGRSFRRAWRQASPLEQEAARTAAASPDQAARSLSDAIGHALQLAVYAAEDWHRLQTQQAQAEHKRQEAGAVQGAIRRAADELRKGRMTQEQSEKYLRQATMDAARDTERQASMQAPPDDAGGRQVAIEHVARDRFMKARRHLADQLAETHRKLAAAPKDAADAPNRQIAMQVDRTLSRIDELFLDNKAVHDPVAPQPKTADAHQEDGTCPTPRG